MKWRSRTIPVILRMLFVTPKMPTTKQVSTVVKVDDVESGISQAQAVVACDSKQAEMHTKAACIIQTEVRQLQVSSSTHMISQTG